MWVKEKWHDVILERHRMTSAVDYEIEGENQRLYSKGVEALRKKNWKKAEKINRQLINILPTFAPGYNNLAVVLLNQGRNEEAIDILKKVIEVDPSYVFASSTLVQIYITEDRIDEAEELLKTIVIPKKVHPDAMVCYLSTQVQLNLHKKNLDTASKFLDQALEISPDNPQLLQMRKQLSFSQVVNNIRKIHLPNR